MAALPTPLSGSSGAGPDVPPGLRGQLADAAKEAAAAGEARGAAQRDRDVAVSDREAAQKKGQLLNEELATLKAKLRSSEVRRHSGHPAAPSQIHASAPCGEARHEQDPRTCSQVPTWLRRRVHRSHRRRPYCALHGSLGRAQHRLAM